MTTYSLPESQDVSKGVKKWGLHTYLEYRASSGSGRSATWQGFAQAGLGHYHFSGPAGFHAVWKSEKGRRGTPLGPAASIYEEQLHACTTTPSYTDEKDKT